MTSVTHTGPTTDLDHVVQQLERDVGPPESWPPPVQLGSLALCVMNSILSTGNRSESVVRVLNRYREVRREADSDPELDGPDDLLATISACGGPAGLADALDNHWRAWSRKTAPLKMQVIQEAAALLQSESVLSREDLVAAWDNLPLRSRLKQGWLALPGQRSGLTWRYFAMNAGMPGIKADRMLTRWVARTLERTTTSDEVERLLTMAATRLQVDARHLDHALWSFERGRS